MNNSFHRQKLKISIDQRCLFVMTWLATIEVIGEIFSILLKMKNNFHRSFTDLSTDLVNGTTTVFTIGPVSICFVTLATNT